MNEVYTCTILRLTALPCVTKIYSPNYRRSLNQAETAILHKRKCVVLEKERTRRSDKLYGEAACLRKHVGNKQRTFEEISAVYTAYRLLLHKMICF